MSEDDEGKPKPATAVDGAAPAVEDDGDYADDGGEAEDGDYDDEDEDDGADVDADDESDVDADDDTPEQPAAELIAEPPTPPPSNRGTLIMIGVFVAIVGVFAYVKLRTPEEDVPPAAWARYHDVATTFSLELPAQPIQGTDPQPNLMARLGAREYGVFWQPIGDEEAWKNIDKAVLEKGTILRQLSLPESAASFVFKTPQGMFAGVRAVRRDKVGYLIMTGAYIDGPDLERPLRTFQFEPAPP